MGRKFIEMKDDYGLTMKVRIVSYNLEKEWTREFYFLTSSCIVNETPFDLVFYSTNKQNSRLKPIAGQEKMENIELEKNILIFDKKEELSFAL